MARVDGQKSLVCKDCGKRKGVDKFYTTTNRGILYYRTKCRVCLNSHNWQIKTPLQKLRHNIDVDRSRRRKVASA